jgi:hypothetical protein
LHAADTYLEAKVLRYAKLVIDAEGLGVWKRLVEEAEKDEDEDEEDAQILRLYRDLPLGTTPASYLRLMNADVEFASSTKVVRLQDYSSLI